MDSVMIYANVFLLCFGLSLFFSTGGGWALVCVICALASLIVLAMVKEEEGR